MGVVDSIATVAQTALHACSPHVETMRRTLRVVRWIALVPLIVYLALAVAFEVETRWVVLFLLVAGVMTLVRQRHIQAAFETMKEDQTAQTAWQHYAVNGLRWLAILAAVIGISIYWRIASPTRALIFLLCYAACALWVLVTLNKRQDGDERQNVVAEVTKVFAGLMLGPFVWAWLTVSTIQGIWTLGQFAGGSWHEHAPWEQTRATRKEKLEAWDRQDRPPVAVTLSGGGYRAAAAHSGVLWVLERAGIPIHALSTVSGGSIVGAAYALGWTPEQFRRRLCAGQPGLPSQMMNFYPVMGQLLLPWWSSGDTYWLHFYLTYFHGHTLADTGPPELIVNATDYREGRRASFWRERRPKTRLADLVAASGAFPVVFEPVRIEEGHYMDGGVVENLGLEGLLQFLQEHQSLAPGLVVVSDLSAEPKAVRLWQKPSVFQMATHSMDVTYQALHARIFDLYSDGQFGRVSRGSEPAASAQAFAIYPVKAQRFWPWAQKETRVAILRPTSLAERARFDKAEHEKVQLVAGIDTLRELGHQEVDAAFWLGARITADYLPDLCRAAGLGLCPTVDANAIPSCAKPESPATAGPARQGLSRR